MPVDARNLEDIYELAPLQEGMLFHQLSAPGSEVYCEQMRFSVDGELNEPAFTQAWQDVLALHPALRTGFQWEGLARPAQVVHRRAVVPLEWHDWSDAAEQANLAERLDRFAAGERARGFELDRPPLMRVAVIRTAPGTRQVIWTHSHLLLDGWCLPILLGQLTQAYAARAAGTAPRLAAGRPYRDFVGWLRRRDQAVALRFWSERLAGCNEPTPLPAGYALSARPSAMRAAQPGADAASAERMIQFDPEVTASLAEWCRRERITISTLCQGAWALALGRLTGRREVVFGITVAGRPADLAGVEEMIGLFIHALPCRAKLRPEAAPADWLRELQAETAAARAHEHTPLVAIKASSDLPAGAELFATLFAFENYPAAPREAPGAGRLALHGVSVHERTHYAFTVVAAVVEGRLGLRLLADLNRLSRDSADQAADRFQRAILALAGSAESGPAGDGGEEHGWASPAGKASAARVFDPRPAARSLAEIDLLSGQERARLCPAPAATAAPPTWLTAFEEHVGRQPDAEALRCGAEVYSYAALSDRAARIAAELRARGAGPEQRVAVCLPRSADLIVAILAVLQAGAAYVPLDPAYPAERLEWMLEDSAAALLITAPDRADRFTAAKAPLVRWESSLWSGSAVALPAPISIRARTLAYLIYTSGSTGRPKGVMIEHGSWSHLVQFQRQVCRLGSGDRVLQFSSSSFDASVWEMGLALSSGAALVAAPAAELLPGDPLARTLRESRISSVLLPPSALAHLPAGAYPDLKLLIVGGEACWPDLIARWATPGRRVVNAYGPTETTVIATWAECSRPDGTPLPGGVPIGTPLPHFGARVLDPDGVTVLPGVAGELCLSGPALSRGYWNRAELTASRFVANPVGGRADDRLYRTGDLVRWRRDGQLDYAGRLDRQVKVRGFRIEPGEIEAALTAHPAVREAAVDARRGPEGEAALAAWVALKPDGPVTLEELRDWLRARLPAHYVPAEWAIVAALPQTPGGKVDSAALPAPSRLGGEMSAPAAPGSLLADLAAEAFAAVLAMDRVGLDEDFFELGGHSLAATRLVARLRDELAAELPLRAVFEAPTPRRLGERLAAERGQSGVATTARAVRPPGAPIPASFGQQRFWMLEQLSPGNAGSLIPLAVRIRGTLDVEKLERAWAALVARHEPLRTAFREENGELYAVPAHQRGAEAFQAFVARPRAGDESLEGFRSRGGESFDLARGPLWRAELTAVAPDEHLLSFTFHHAIIDGWSLAILIRELARLYGGAELAPLPVSYGDYAFEQRGQSASWTGEIAEWKQELTGIAALDLPTDAPRPAVATDRGALLTLAFPAPEARKLRALSRAEGATLFMTLLAAWEVCLWRQTGQTDFGVGVPVAGRTRREWDELIGLFVNTLVVRSDIAAEISFAELVGRVRRRSLWAFDRSSAPFERIIEAVQPERDLSRPPLFQVMFSLQNAPRSDLRVEGLTIAPEPVGAAGAKFELTLTACETEGGALEFGLEYNRDLFSAETARRLLDRYAQLLRSAAARPATLVRDLDWIPAAERAELAAWTKLEGLPGPASTLVERFEAQVRRSPAAIALSGEAGVMTYQELDTQAGRLARELRRRGAGPEDRIALCLPRSFELVAAILGTLKAGAAYLPLDPDHPADRLAAILADAQPKAVVTVAELAARFPWDAAVIRWSELPGAAAAAPPEPRAALLPQHPAYVIYTSGSTGRPKGVIVTHENATRLFDATAERFGFGPADVWTLFHSYTFDFSVWELWGPLLYGGRLVVVPYLVTRSPLEFRRLAQREGVTVLNQTPSAFYQWMQADRELFPVPERTALRLVIFGGEALSLDRLTEWYQRHPSDAPVLVNMYGITETTVHVTWLKLDEAMAAHGGPSRVGRAIPGWAVHVLDEDLAPVPPGVRGEFYVAGAGLARGYLDRPGLTAERFVPHPWGAPGERLYRTGDVGRRRADGSLEYLGRNDHQVKIRGFRIELGEIEAALARLPAVREAVVCLREDAAGGRLIGYVIPREGGPESFDRESARRALAQAVPDYMVPASLVAVERWPLTVNGKLDRRALPEPAASAAVLPSDAPQGAIEEFVAAVWSELLEVKAVARTDNFFSLGGHSLLATQFISRVREQLGVELPLMSLFEDPTPQACAAAIAAREKAPGQAAAAAARGRTGEPGAGRPPGTDAPLSYAQRRLWFLDRMVPGNPAYAMVFAFRLIGPLDVAAWAKSLAAVAARHEALRTIFLIAGAEAEPVQRIIPAEEFEIPLAVAAAEPGADPLAAAEALAREEAARPFALEQGPLVRVRVLRLGEEEHAVVCCLHHIISDGWSTGVFIREIGARYAAITAAGTAPPPPSLALQYADYALAQRSPSGEAEMRGALEWWKTQLAGLPPLDLPADYPRPAVQSFRAGRVEFQLDATDRDALAKLAQSADATLFTVLLAAYSAALGAWSGQTDFAVGTPVAGRTRREWEPLIGFFVNTLALRADLSRDPTFAEVLRRTRRMVQEALTRQEAPFDRLVEELNPDRQLGHAPLVQAALAFEVSDGQKLDLIGLKLEPIELDLGVAKFDLTLSLSDSGGGVRGALDYRSDLFAPAAAARFVRLFTRMVRGALAAPEAKLAELAAPDDAERAELARWETGARVEATLIAGPEMGRTPKRPEDKSLHLSAGEAVAGWARRAPEAPAIRSGEEVVSYGQLFDRAAALAEPLRAAGVGPEKVVAICLARSPELIVAQLACWLAGGAFLPLDPAHPAERLQATVADADICAILTDAPNEPHFPADKIVRWSALPPTRWGASEVGDLSEPPTPSQLAYVIATSGSTGRPKGVEITHAALASLIRWHLAAFALAPGDLVSLVAGPAFDASIWEIWPALAAGACLTLPPPEVVLHPAGLRDWLIAAQVTVSFAPTPLAELLLTLPWPAGRGALRWLLTGGDRLHRAPPAGLPFQLSNNYGPTESTVVATSGPTPPGSGESAAAPDIGRPIAATRLLLLDAGLRRLPPGAVGEIFLGGAGLARGYRGRPDLTAEAFLPDPFSPAKGDRLYRTGDLARWRSDGTLEFRGRADRQVKIRGVRLELGEVEAALLDLPGVSAALAEVRVRGGHHHPALLAWLIADEGSRDEAAARSALRRRLPPAMIPAHLVWLDRWPVTPNGKVDRARLPDPGAGGMDPAVASGHALIGPSNELEERIAGVWAEVLGRTGVGVTDNFFDVGGHSLLLVQVHAGLQRVLGRPVTLLDLFAYPTVRALAEHLAAVEAPAPTAARDASDRARAQREAAARRRRTRSEAVPLP